MIEEGIVSIEDIAASVEITEYFSEAVVLIFPSRGGAMLFLESIPKSSVWRKLISPPSKSVLPEAVLADGDGDGERWLIFKIKDLKYSLNQL